MQQSKGGRTVRGAAVGLLTVVVAAGCSFSFGTKAVEKEEVAEKAFTSLSAEVGQEPDEVTCEDDLKAEEGATVRCELTDNGKRWGVTATVKSVNDGNVQMNFEVDPTSKDGGQAAGTAPPTDSTTPTQPVQPSNTAGSGSGTQKVARTEVARQGRAALAAKVGQQPDAFTCSRDLRAQVNATTRCLLTDGGKQYGVTATVVSVNGGNVQMNFKVDNVPQ